MIPRPTVPPLPRVIGHRGAAALAPENTLTGFAVAAAAGAGWVEFDVRLTADMVPVLLHDRSLTRTTGLARDLGDVAFADLAGLDAGDGAPPPSLAAALVRLQGLGLGANIELKSDSGREAATAHAVIAALRAGWTAPVESLLLTSFAEPCLETLAAHAGDLPRGYLVTRLPGDWAARADRLGCGTVALGDDGADRGAIAAVKASGRRLLVWTINSVVRARDLLQAGVDANISDDPGTLVAALGT